jgi:hypothetical protein
MASMDGPPRVPQEAGAYFSRVMPNFLRMKLS